MTEATVTAPALFSGRADVNYLSTLNFDDSFLAALQAAAPGVEVRQLALGSPGELSERDWATVDVLHTSTVLPDPALAPRLRWVQLDTSGVDHVRTLPVWASDVAITTIGGISPVPLAEYVIWAILGTAHRMPALLEVRASRRWPEPDRRWQTLMPAPVRGATVGVIGYGRIGREIGRLARALGMNVLGVSRTAGASVRVEHYNDAPAGAGAADDVEIVGPDRLHDVMRRSDYLVVVVPLTAQTAGLVDAAALAELKAGAVVINVARGGIVDEQALSAQLRAGRVRAAVLDVFDDEPLAADHPWWDEPSVFVTPHVSGLAPDYSRGVLDIVGENVRRFVERRPLLNVVDRVQGY